MSELNIAQPAEVDPPDEPETSDEIPGDELGKVTGGTMNVWPETGRAAIAAG